MKDKIFHPAPVWLTKAYLEPVLRKCKKDNKLIIEKLDIKPASAKGENYASVMTRIYVEYQLSTCKDTQQGSYIVKTTHENDPVVANIMNQYDVYNTEMLMYEKILPQLSELLRESGDQDKLFADTIFVDYEHLAIIFEDLAILNYTVADRLVGLTEVESKLALQKLAKMHAASAVFNERNPGLLTKLSRGLFNRHTHGLRPFFENMFMVAANFAGDCPELGMHYKEKLLKLKEHVMEYGNRAYEDGSFKTLIHGDFWVCNVMLNSNGSCVNQPTSATENDKDLKIIDFQFCCWASPAIDLHYFLNTSMQPELRTEYRHDEFVQYYHTILTDTLRKLKYAEHIPTLHEFCIQLEQGRFFAVISALVSQAVMINDNTEDADFCNFISDDERGRNFRNILYSNKKIQEITKQLLPIFDRKGLLDLLH